MVEARQPGKGFSRQSEDVASGAAVLKTGSRSQNLDVGSAVTLQVTSCFMSWCCSGLTQRSGEDPGPCPPRGLGGGVLPSCDLKSEVTGQVEWRTRGSFWAPVRGWAAAFITELCEGRVCVPLTM